MRPALFSNAVLSVLALGLALCVGLLIVLPDGGHDLRADVLPAPTAPTGVDFTPPVGAAPAVGVAPTLGVGEAGYPKARLKKKNSDANFESEYLSRWPATVPADYAAMRAVPVPDGRKLFELDFGSNEGKAGWYSGPDGGQVYVWGRKQYMWKRVDGTELQFSPDGGWRLAANGHVIFRPGAPQIPDGLWWTFPDGSRLTSFSQGIPPRTRYLAERDTDEGLVAFEILDTRTWSSLVTEFSNLQLYYTPAWTAQIEALRSRDVYEPFLRDLETELGWRNAGPIPVVFLDTLDRMRGFTGSPSANEGGLGGMHGVVICCGNKQPPVPAQPAVRAARLRAESLTVVLHEIGHNLQQHRCSYVRNEYKREHGGAEPPPAPHPGDWYVEGVAEYGVMRNQPRERARMFRDLFQRLDTRRIPSAAELGYRDGNAYVWGRSILAYVAETKGTRAIRAYYDATCLGTPAAEALRSATGRDLGGLLKDTIAHYTKRRPEIEASFFDWDLDGLAQVEALPISDDSKPLPADFPLPKSALDIKLVPGVYNAYRMDVAAYAGQYEGTFRGPNGERVFLWNNGTYQVETRRLRVTHHGGNSGGEGEVDVEIAGHKIMNWSNGQRRWVLPNGSYFHMWSATQPAGAFDKNGKELRR